MVTLLTPQPTTLLWCGAAYPMSRHSTPTSAVGRLDLRESSSSSSSGMVVETRAQRKRAVEQSVRHAAASSSSSRTPAVTAGPSRLAGGGGGSGQSSRPRGKQPASALGTERRTGSDDDDDDEDDDDDGGGGGDSGGHDDDDDDDRNWIQTKRRIILEIFSLYTHGLLTPIEFFELPSNASGNNDQRLRRIADHVTANITTQAQLVRYRATCPEAYCLQRTVSRMSERRYSISGRLESTIRSGSNDGNGTSILSNTIDDYRRLFQAIGRLIERYEAKLSDAQKQSLVTILYQVLDYGILRMDRDVYANSGAPLPPYSSQTSMNLWHSFCSPLGQPGIFVEVLVSLPRELLQTPEMLHVIYGVCAKLNEGGDGHKPWAQRLLQHYTLLRQPEA